jgi:hypothetical protein
MTRHSDDDKNQNANARAEEEEKIRIKLFNLAFGPALHPPFDDVGVRGLIRRIQQTFAEFENRPVRHWEEEFRRDHHPEREIAIWLHIAAVYEHFIQPRPLQERLCRECKHEIFRLCVACLLNGPRELQAASDLVTPHQLQSQAIADYYFAKPTLVSSEDLEILHRYFDSRQAN